MLVCNTSHYLCFDGAICKMRDSIEKSNKKWLEPLPFNSLLVGRRKKGKEMKFAKCYYWPKLE